MIYLGSIVAGYLFSTVLDINKLKKEKLHRDMKEAEIVLNEQQ
jgi:hypothetical protein